MPAEDSINLAIIKIHPAADSINLVILKADGTL